MDATILDDVTHEQPAEPRGLSLSWEWATEVTKLSREQPAKPTQLFCVDPHLVTGKKSIQPQ